MVVKNENIQVRQIRRSYVLSVCSLKMPSWSTVLHAVEDIPLPDVPPAVLQLVTLENQVAEMQEWFRAFAEQNHTIRDYRSHFKPILCYKEAAWVYPDLEEVDDWYDLHEKIRLDRPCKIPGDNYFYMIGSILLLDDS